MSATVKLSDVSASVTAERNPSEKFVGVFRKCAVILEYIFVDRDIVGQNRIYACFACIYTDRKPVKL